MSRALALSGIGTAVDPEDAAFEGAIVPVEREVVGVPTPAVVDIEPSAVSAGGFSAVPAAAQPAKAKENRTIAPHQRSAFNPVLPYTFTHFDYVEITVPGEGWILQGVRRRLGWKRLRR